MRRITAFMVFLVMLVLPSCSKDEAVLSYKDTSLTKNEYNYLVSTFKAKYLTAYTDIKDNNEFWQGDYGGKTGQELLDGLIYENITKILISSQKFDEAGQKLTDAEVQDVRDYIDSMTEELAGGERSELDGYLAEFGIDADKLEEIMLLQARADGYYDYLYGSNGIRKITEAQANTYYRDNYVRFAQIYISTAEVVVTDDDGKALRDENGREKTRPLTQAEMQVATDKIAAVKSKLDEGENFTAVFKELSDSKDYENGYYFSPETATDYLTEVYVAAAGLEENEWTYVDLTDTTGGFFVKRLALDDKAWEKEANSDFFSDFKTKLSESLFDEHIDEVREKITADEEYIKGISAKDLPANYYYY